MNIQNYATRIARFMRMDKFTKMQILQMKLHLLKKEKIVFDNFGGRGYGDNPKYISEEIHRQNLDWDMVWLVKNPDAMPPYVRSVPYDSEQAVRELATAQVVVRNVRSSLRVPKRRGQIFLQTWHGGMAFKKVEGEAEDSLPSSYIAAAKRDGHECDAIISACALRSEQYRNYFWLNEHTEILEIGQPRCDILFDNSHTQICSRIRDTFGIDQDTGIILYAPTFRDNGSTLGYIMQFDEILHAFEEKFHQKFVILVRLHPNAQKLCNYIQYDQQIINATYHPDMQELVIASDFLITDYSGATFDFALLNKPVFICAMDYESYQKQRDLSQLYQISPFPKSDCVAALLRSIAEFSYDSYQSSLYEFRKIWKPFDDGHASARVVEWIKSRISGSNHG